MKKIAGINGFGRFGLHLLKYWLDRNQNSSFSIKYINDDSLNMDQIYKIITTDKYVNYNKYKIQKDQNSLVFLEPNGKRHEIIITNEVHESISWLGKPDFFFECSGKNTLAENCENFLKDNTSLVLISATSWNADSTIVYGYNHTQYDSSKRIISYGSCTVNAYVPFTNWIENSFGIIDSDVNVIHNIQEYRLSENKTLNRKFCTLEKSAVNLLESINQNNFLVNYTVIPYTGVSMIDFRFRIKTKVTYEKFIEALNNSVNNGDLKDLYGLDEKDIGPEVYNCTTFSTVFIKENIKVINDNIYLQGYFDNENSVNRYFDLANYLSKK